MNGMPTIIIIYLVFSFLPHYDSIMKKSRELTLLFLYLHTSLISLSSPSNVGKALRLTANVPLLFDFRIRCLSLTMYRRSRKHSLSNTISSSISISPFVSHLCSPYCCTDFPSQNFSFLPSIF